MLTAPRSPALAKLGLSLAVIGLLLGLLPGAHAETTFFVNQTTDDSSNSRFFGTQNITQNFSMPQYIGPGWNLTLAFRKEGTPLYRPKVTLHNQSAGVPGAIVWTYVLSQAEADSIATSPATTNITMTVNIPLTNGAVYHVMAQANDTNIPGGGPTNSFNIAGSGTIYYTGHTAQYSAGAVWTVFTWNTYFIVWNNSVDATAPVWTTGTSPASNNNTNFTNALTLDAGVYDAELNTANLTVFNSTLFPWLYRQTINITNNNGTAALPLNYTVNLTFDHATLVTAGQSNASGWDVRVLYNFSVELDRLNLTAFNTTTTTIAFRTREIIPAGGNATNYEIYYGYPGAGPPPANPNNVYLFFDNFSYSSCNAAFNSTWTLGWNINQVPFGGNCSMAEGALQLDINGTYFDLGYYTNQSFPQDVLVSVKMRVNELGTSGTAIMYRYNISDPTVLGSAWPYLDYEYDGLINSTNENTSRFLVGDNYGLPDIRDGGNITIGTWYTEEARLYNVTWRHYLDGVFLTNRTLTGVDPNGVSFLRPGRVALAAWGSAWANVSYDDVLVREYMDPEPSATSALTIPPAQVVAYCSNTSWADTEWNSSAECGAFNTSSWREAVYYFNLTASDDAGNVTTEYYRMNLTRNKFNFSIRVFRGWNLIGLWNDTTLLTASNWTAAPANITIVQCFNSTSQSLAKYNWTNGTGNSTYLCPRGTAVFIQIGRNDTLNFTEITLNEWVPNAGGNWTANVSLTVGYNYLLVPGNVSLKNASTWPLKGVKYASCWNASRQAYFSYLNTSTWAGGLGNTSLCVEGQGIVLQALGNETITLGRMHTYPASGEGYGFGYVAAAVLVLAGGAYAYRWYSRKGEN